MKKQIAIVFTSFCLLLMVFSNIAHADIDNAESSAIQRFFEENGIQEEDIVDVVQGEMESVTLSVSVGETASKEVSVPLTFVLKDGSRFTYEEIVSLTLTNDVRNQLGVSSAASMMVSTKTCAGEVSGSSGRKFRSVVNFEYNGSQAHFLQAAGYLWANWPWSPDFSLYYHWPPTWDNPINVYHDGYFKLVFWPYSTSQANIDWTLTGAGGCSFTGGF